MTINKRPLYTLRTLGWHPFFETAFTPLQSQGLIAGRVVVENRHQYMVYTPQGNYIAEIAGKLHFQADSSADLPKVGDWVAVIITNDDNAIIQQILPRRTKFSRQAAGRRTEEQMVATNVDMMFVVQSLDNDFNTRRLERYLAMVFEGGIQPAIILNKADLCADVEAKKRAIEAVVTDNTPIIVISALKNLLGDINYQAGFEMLQALLREGQTYAFIGSSGVGKSTLLNLLFGEIVQKTGQVRQGDSKGRHITTQRELFVLPKGGLLIDTPGMREFHLWEVEAGLAETFTDIEEVAESCHFSDCTHIHEKGCAVLTAVQQDHISQTRYESYLKLQKEAREIKTTQTARRRRPVGKKKKRRKRR